MPLTRPSTLVKFRPLIALFAFAVTVGLYGYVLSAKASAVPFELNGQPSSTFLGDPADGNQPAVAGGCDVNADGKDDLLIGTTNPDGGAGRGTPGKIYVLLQGQTSLLTGTSVAKIEPVGIADKWELGTDIECGGDVNGDGTDDIVIGAPGYREPGSTSVGPGAAFVVFGGSGFVAGSTIDIAPLGDIAASSSKGFRIQGETTRDRLGLTVAFAGDLDSDGLDDVLVGNGVADSYLTSVVYPGLPAGFPRYALPFGPILTTSGGANLLAHYEGLKVNSSVASVAGPGDLDGDGVGDVLLGSPITNQTGTDAEGAPVNLAAAGAVYAIDGNARGTIDVRSAEEVITEFKGDTAGGNLGAAVSGAGDVNGDGRADVLIAASRGSSLPGSTWVLYPPAEADTVDIAGLDLSHGYRIEGPSANSRAGNSIATIGDINGDEIPDHLIGAPRHAPGGAAYVVFGQREDPTDLSLASLEEDQGARFLGGANAGIGTGVSTAGTQGGSPSILATATGGATLVSLGDPTVSQPPTDPDPDVEQAEVDWGFRSSFRSYVYAGNGSPPISATNGANCPVDPVRGVGCEPRPGGSSSPVPTGALTWTPIGATWDLATGTAKVATSGTVTFSYPGHFFTLKLSDPVFTIDGSKVSVDLMADLESTLDSVPSAKGRVAFGTFELAGEPSETDSTVTWKTGPGQLTIEAAELLGDFLAAGAELDPAFITIPKALGPAVDPPVEPGIETPEPETPETVTPKLVTRSLWIPVNRKGVGRLRLECGGDSACESYLTLSTYGKFKIFGHKKPRSIRLTQRPVRVGAGKSKIVSVRIPHQKLRLIESKRRARRAVVRIVTGKGRDFARSVHHVQLLPK